jgi:hypothetical protein
MECFKLHQYTIIGMASIFGAVMDFIRHGLAMAANEDTSSR